MNAASKLLSSPLADGRHWVDAYVAERLATKRAATVEAYTLILRQFVNWVAERPGHQQHFHPSQLTKTAVETYLTTHLGASSISHRSRVKSVIAGFCQWLIEEEVLLTRNPTHGVKVPAQQLLAPRELSDEQRYILKELVERSATICRGRRSLRWGIGRAVGSVMSPIWRWPTRTWGQRLAGCMWATKGTSTGPLT